MTFNQWLIENNYITDESQIGYELSAPELDELYSIYKLEY